MTSTALVVPKISIGLQIRFLVWKIQTWQVIHPKFYKSLSFVKIKLWEKFQESDVQDVEKITDL